MTRTNLLDARTVDFLELIGNGRTFSVPPYQRDYSWNTEEWDDLWSDIAELRDQPEERHYMGAVLVKSKTDFEFLVIDGQQRLATLSLFALAVTKRLRTLADSGLDTEANRSRAQALHDRFIGEKDPASLLEASRLSLNETDNGFYRDYLVQDRTPSNPRALQGSKRQIWDCYRFFLQKLEGDARLQSDGEALAKFLSLTVARQLLFIIITVEDELNAYTVFETLNARGVSLTTTDLLKNYLLSRVRTPSDVDDLHRRWRTLVGTVKAGRFPDFLRYHLLSRYSRIRRPNLFKIVRDQFRTLPEVFDLLEQLESRAELFAALTDSSHDYWKDLPEARPFIQEQILFRVRQMTPLLFTVWERFSQQDFLRVLKFVSVISFRYNIVSALSRSELEPAYAQAAKAVAAREAVTPGAVFRALDSIYVDDEKMAQDFSRLWINTHGVRKKVVRYILARLEGDASGGAVDTDVDQGSIEHILPENPDESWEEEFARERHEAFLYRIGNLTLLEKKANRDIGNRPYADKVAAYERSRYTLTRQVAEMAPEEWTPALIEHRQEKLAARAVQIWRADFA